MGGSVSEGFVEEVISKLKLEGWIAFSLENCLSLPSGRNRVCRTPEVGKNLACWSGREGDTTLRSSPPPFRLSFSLLEPEYQALWDEGEFWQPL